MAFGKKVEVIIGKGETGLLVSDLNISFKVKRTNTLDQNTCGLTIYNAKEDTRSRILSEGSTIVVKAGYEDENNTSIIFIGTIVKAKNRKEDVNWVTEIEAVDLGKNQDQLKFSTLSLSYAPKTPLANIISDLAGTLGIPLSGIENVTSIENGSYVISGTIGTLVRDIQRKLKTNGLEMFFDNNEIVIFKTTGATTVSVASISPDSGLVGSPDVFLDYASEDQAAQKTVVKKRVSFKCLLNPKLKPNSAFVLRSGDVNGVFIADTVEFTGDNMEGEFTTTVEAHE